VSIGTLFKLASFGFGVALILHQSLLRVGAAARGSVDASVRAARRPTPSLNGHSSVDGKPLWRHAEHRAEQFVKSDGDLGTYKWTAQKCSRTQGTRLDLWGYKHVGGKRVGVVVDVKYVDKLKSSYIDQLNGYAGPPFFARRRIIICHKGTVVPDFFAGSGVEVMPLLSRPEKFAHAVQR
jgi:hypothetical protein